MDGYLSSIQSFVVCAVEMNLAWSLNERERLTLYYDYVKESGQLAGSQCFFFLTSSGGQSRIKCVAFTHSKQRKTKKR